MITKEPKTVSEKKTLPTEPKMGTCIFCETFGEVTVDHVPPKQLFPKPRPSTLITVPSCYSCNQASQKDEVYFQMALANWEPLLNNPDARKVCLDSVVPNFSRKENAGLMAMMESTKMFPVPLYDEEGKFVRFKYAYGYENERFEKVAEKVVKGLFYHETNKIFSKDLGVLVTSWMGRRPPAHIIKTVRELPSRKVISERVFSYRFWISVDKARSMWFLLFYEIIPFVCVTADRLTIERINENLKQRPGIDLVIP